MSFTHHQIVAALESDVADRLLDLAQKRKWAAQVLRDKVAEINRPAPPPSPPAAPLPVPVTTQLPIHAESQAQDEIGDEVEYEVEYEGDAAAPEPQETVVSLPGRVDAFVAASESLDLAELIEGLSRIIARLNAFDQRAVREAIGVENMPRIH